MKLLVQRNQGSVFWNDMVLFVPVQMAFVEKPEK